MSERTNHLEAIQHLDFNLECGVTATIYRNGQAIGTMPVKHSGPAIADVVYETFDGRRRESFMCKGCLSWAEQEDQVIYVHRIG